MKGLYRRSDPSKTLSINLNEFSDRVQAYVLMDGRTLWALFKTILCRAAAGTPYYHSVRSEDLPSHSADGVCKDLW